MNSDGIDRLAKVIAVTLFGTAMGTLFSAGRAIRNGYDLGDWVLMASFYAAGSFAMGWYMFRD